MASDQSRDDTVYTYQPINYGKLSQELEKLEGFASQVKLLKETVLLSPAERSQRTQFTNKLSSILSSKHFKGTFHQFGSSANSMGFKDSDIDLYFELEEVKEVNGDSGDLPREFVIKELNRIRGVLDRALKMSIWSPVKARIPILQLNFETNMLPKNRNLKNGLKCDISLTSNHGVCHARLLSYFSELEPLFLELAMVTKYWTKRSNWTSPHRLTSFAGTLMVVFYLQRRRLLPAVRSLQIAKSTADKAVYDFENNHSCFAPPPEKPSLARLFLDFFQFYSDFDFTHDLVSTHEGRGVPKATLEHLNPTYSKPPNRICVQDPFDLSRNQSQGMTENFQTELLGSIKFIAETSKKIQMDFPNENVAAQRLFNKLVQSPVVNAGRKKHGTPRLSMASVSEWRRPRVLADWRERFPVITRSVLSQILDTTITMEEDLCFSPLDGTRKVAVSEFECAVTCHSLWRDRFELKKSLERYLGKRRFIEKELFVSYLLRITPDAHEKCNHDVRKKVTFQLVLNPDPNKTLVSIEFVKPRPEDMEMNFAIKSYLLVFYSKYFGGNEDTFREDMTIFGVEIE